MNRILPDATGLEVRFEEEMAAAIPGWGGVRHNAAEKRFEIETGERPAVVEYRLAEGRMILAHTFVPPEFRGQKLAERLVTAALNFARAQRMLVVPQCSYVETFIRRHPEFSDLRAG